MEDSAADAELEQRELRRARLEFTLRRVETREEFVAALQDFTPHVILADFSLPLFSGMEALALACELAPVTPVIVVTGSLNEETAADCIKAGAVDYVLKEHLARLAPAVRSALERRRIAEQKASTEEALRANERKYRALFTESRDGMFIADVATQELVDANPAIIAMSGYRVEHLRGVSLLSLVPPHLTAEAREAWDAVGHGATRGPLELEMLRADGTYLPVEVRAGTYSDADGAVRMFGVVRDVSDRRRRLRELEASETRHRALFEEAQDAILVADPATGMVVDGNRAAQEMVGRTRDELRQMHQSELHPPEERDEVRAGFANDAQSPSPRGARVTVLSREGRRIPVEISSSRILDESGRPLLVGIFHDLRERLAAETALRESEVRFGSVVEGAPEALFTYADERFTYVNPAARRLFGAATAEELVGRPVTDRIDPADRAIVRERMRLLVEANEPVPVREGVLLRMDGTPFDVEVSSVPFPHGGRSGVLTFVRDITRRKREAAERLLLATALEQADEAVIITDTTGTIRYVNPAFERVTGYGSAETVGQNPRILKSGVQDAAFYVEMWKSLTAGQVYRRSFVNRRKNGEHYVAEVVISPVRDGAGRVVSYVGLQRDVTREQDLADQLRQAQKMEAVGQLTGGIAHDFNNLLGVVLANAALLRDALPTPSGVPASCLDDLEDAARSGRDLVRKLLGFSRQEQLKLAPLDLGDFLRATESTLRRLLSETIDLRLDVAEAVGPALCDAGALTQILLNVATNASDAMPGGGSLAVSAREVVLHSDDEVVLAGQDRPGRYACITVADSGCGMDEELLSHVFMPFFTTKEPGKGTGLGLAMVYGLMQQQGGFVRIYSEKGSGTTVRLYLPLAEGSVPAPKPPPRSTRARPSGSETVLVVEDQELLRRATARALQKLGYGVIVAVDGEEGLAAIQEHGDRIALVLTDVVMPKLGGIELLQRVRALGRPTRFLLMSGYAAGSGATPREIPAPLIEKPWTVEDLARKVREVIEGPPEA